MAHTRNNTSDNITFTEKTMTNETEVLKPCPFCGGTETHVEERTYWTGMRSEVTHVEVKHWCNKGAIKGGFLTIKGKTREDAINRWNTRTPTPSPDELRSEWQPIESAPKDGTKILIKDREDIGDGLVYVAKWAKHCDGWGYDKEPSWCVEFKYGRNIKYPTHWMPLHKTPDEQALSTTTAPADETLRDILQKLDLEVEGLHRRNRSASGYIDPERGERMKALMDKLNQALPHPPKTAMSREELVGILEPFGFEDRYSEVAGLLTPDMAITALEAAGVLNVKAE